MSSKGKSLEERGANICELMIIRVSPVPSDEEEGQPEAEKEGRKNIEEVDSNVNRGASIMEEFSKSKHPSSVQ